MAAMAKLILGEVARTFDDRYRVAIPAELVEALVSDGRECILAKERPGCLSLWNAATWEARLEEGVGLVEARILARRLDDRLDDVQRLGRLLSTRHRKVQLAGRGRLVVPEGFREFLGVEPSGTVMIVGAAVCVEIWRPDAWQQFISEQMPDFRGLLERLVG
jgi:MraZ protein